VLSRLPEFKAYGFEINEDLFSETAKSMQQENPDILSLDFAAVSFFDGKTTFYEMGKRRKLHQLKDLLLLKGLILVRNEKLGFV